MDSLVASELDVLRVRISEAHSEVNDAELVVTEIEKSLAKAKDELERKRERKRMLTEHMCIIISETERQKEEKLRCVYEKMEEEERGVREARRDLARAISKENRKANGEGEGEGGMGGLFCFGFEIIFCFFTSTIASPSTH